jgi:hypothetical protein
VCHHVAWRVMTLPLSAHEVLALQGVLVHVLSPSRLARPVNGKTHSALYDGVSAYIKRAGSTRTLLTYTSSTRAH